MRFGPRLALALALVACSKAAEVDDSDLPGDLRAGAGQRSIDLPIGHSTGGYAQSPLLLYPMPPDDPGSPFADMFPATRGMESPPSAKVTVLENGHSRLVLARIDAVFVTDVLTERVIQMARERLGADIGGQLLLNATHTHVAGFRARASFRIWRRAWRAESATHWLTASTRFRKSRPTASRARWLLRWAMRSLR